MFLPLYYLGNLPVFNVFFLTVYLEKAIVPTLQMRNGSTGRWGNLLKIVQSSLQWRKKIIPLVQNHKLVSQVGVPNAIILWYDPDLLCPMLYVGIIWQSFCPICKNCSRETICGGALLDILLVVGLPRKSLYLFTEKVVKKIFYPYVSIFLLPTSTLCILDSHAADAVCKLSLQFPVKLLACGKVSLKRLKMKEKKRQPDIIWLTSVKHHSLFQEAEEPAESITIHVHY